MDGLRSLAVRNLLYFLRVFHCAIPSLRFLARTQVRHGAGPELSTNVCWGDVDVLPQRSLTLDCVTHDVLGCVDHPLVEMKYLLTLAFDELMQATAARMA